MRSDHFILLEKDPFLTLPLPFLVRMIDHVCSKRYSIWKSSRSFYDPLSEQILASIGLHLEKTFDA